MEHQVKDQFNLDRALSIGMLPEVYLEEWGKELLSSYVNTYIREEIQAEALARNIAQFSRFIDVAAENSGKEINYSKLSSDSEIPKETLRRYYSVLEDTMLVHRIPGYGKIDKKRKATQREKFVFFDLGVRNAINHQQNNVFTSTEKGQLFEQWLILQLIAFSDYGNLDWKIYYYRDDKGNEVDLVIETPEVLYAIEVKYSEKVRIEFIENLKQFSPLTSKKIVPLVVYLGAHEELIDGIRLLPFQKFFASLAEQVR